MPNFTSPGVYTFENDTSFYSPSINPTVVGIAGFASRGPLNDATLITSPAQLLRAFGNPDQVTGGQGIQGALEILEQSNQLYYVRVATDQAAEAREDLPLGTTPAAVISIPKLDKDTAFRVDFNVTDYQGNTIGQNPTPVYFYRERPGVTGAIPAANFTDTSLSAQAWGDIITKGVADAYGGVDGGLGTFRDGVSGWVMGRDAGHLAKLQVVKSYISSATTAGDALDFDGASVSATPWNIGDFEWTQLLDNAALSANNFIATFSGGSIDVSSANTVAGVAPVTPLSFGDTTGSSILTASGTSRAVTFVPSGSLGAYRVNSQYTGKGYNYATTTNDVGVPVKQGVRVLVRGGNEGRNYLTVESDGALREEFLTRFYEASTAGESLWPEDVINLGTDNVTSQYIKASFKIVSGAASESWDGNLSALVSTPAIATTPPTAWSQVQSTDTNYINYNAAVTTPGASRTYKFIKLVGGDYSLAYGKNGDASDFAGDLTGDDIKTAFIGNSGSKTGFYAFDLENIPVTLVGCPGITTEAIQNSLVTLAESTQKFLSVLAPPLGFSTAQQAIEWSNGNATGRSSSLNSSYAAIYWPWVKVFNAFTGSDEFYDPAIFAIRQMCLTDRVAESWFAPAGLLRGRLTKPTDVEVKLSQGDRDALYGGGNVVNPIVKFNTDGIAIYGQRTTQRAASALDRINVRRLMIYLRRLVLEGTRPFVFEPNDPILWEQVRETLNPALADIQARRGITSYKVICDESTNTPLRIDRNELWCTVQIKPTKAAEVLVFELNVTNQQATV